MIHIAQSYQFASKLFIKLEEATLFLTQYIDHNSLNKLTERRRNTPSSTLKDLVALKKTRENEHMCKQSVL